jgi:phosphodiesterase/alkaline phosphatase D-like protein
MLNRRCLLKGVLATPAVILGGRLASCWAQTPLSADYGVASGDPRPDQVVLWTRVPEAAQASAGEAIAVQYQVATSSSFAPGTIAVQGEVATDSSADYTVKVTAGGLTPATSYYYRFWTATGYQGIVGRSKTAPATEAHPDLISFAFVSCQAFTDGFYTVFARLAQEDVDFCVHLGDTIHEQGSSVVEAHSVREDPIEEATSLAAYRQKYQLYLSGPNLREVRRRFPWVVLGDDHELFDDYAGTVISE